MGISGSAVAAIITAIVAAAASAYSAYSASEQQEAALKAQSRQERNRAQAARDAAAVAEFQARERSDRIRATARARAAASGIDPTEGSPLLIELENARQAEYDAQLIRYGGEVQSGYLGQEARLMTFRGRQARQAGNIGAGVSLLGGVAKAGAIYAGSSPGTSPGGDASYSTSPAYQSQRTGERATY